MPSKSLERGQYQIGDLVMGPYTPFKVEKIDIGNYDLNVQDYQIPGSSETHYGLDTQKPAPIHLTINVMVNRVNSTIAAITGFDPSTLHFENDPNLADLQREWRAEETLLNFGVLKPLYFCGTDGVTRQFYGRPGKFSYTKHKQIDGQHYVVTAEFRRSDTFAYSDTEYFIPFVANTPQTITRTRGNAPNWLRFLIYGPANHPVINFGGLQIELDYNIGANDAVEISSYPWERRVINLAGYSLASYIVSSQPYLDQYRLLYNYPTVISWTATGLTADSKMVMLWRDGYQLMD